jgi:Raf kinase inhibitor-like YbhB/YbcL family protein
MHTYIGMMNQHHHHRGSSSSSNPRLLGHALSLNVLCAIMIASLVFLASAAIKRNVVVLDKDITSAVFPFTPSHALTSNSIDITAATSTTTSISSGDQPEEFVKTTRTRTTPDFTLTSPAFVHGYAIPSLFTRTSSKNDVSPPLTWSNIPNGTASLVLIMNGHPDHAATTPTAASDPEQEQPEPERPWVHWVLYNIPPTMSKLAVGISTKSFQLPPGSRQGLNDWKHVGYVGPCSSTSVGGGSGTQLQQQQQQHGYFFKLYALDIVLDMDIDNNKTTMPQQNSNKAAAATAVVIQAMQGHVLGQAELMGTCKKIANLNK